MNLAGEWRRMCNEIALKDTQIKILRDTIAAALGAMDGLGMCCHGETCERLPDRPRMRDDSCHLHDARVALEAGLSLAIPEPDTAPLTQPDRQGQTD